MWGDPAAFHSRLLSNEWNESDHPRDHAGMFTKKVKQGETSKKKSDQKSRSSKAIKDQESLPQKELDTGSNEKGRYERPLNSKEEAIALMIYDNEARLDKSGNLEVYELSSDDGGGKDEIAGINRYHPEKRERLKKLLSEGKYEEAEKEAKEYYIHYTDSVGKNFSNPGVEAYVRDTAFNRGPAGAVRMVQKALGVKPDGKMGPKTRAAIKEAEKNPKAFIEKIDRVRRDSESNRPRYAEGMKNRWNKVKKKSMEMAD